MKSGLRAELDLLNQDVDEMIRLCQAAVDAGLWTQQQACRHTARLESLRTELNTDFRELLDLHERSNQGLERSRK
jgi:hypothetical protein